MPQVYYVNWFRKSDDGGFLWPGFGENSRVLKWVFERCNGDAKAVETPIGNLPLPADLDFRGLGLERDDIDTLLGVDRDGWLQEIPLIREYYAGFGERLPAELTAQLDQLESALEG
jgi:phosphoenolpyruvate carboxykinase (GTP)